MTAKDGTWHGPFRYVAFFCFSYYLIAIVQGIARKRLKKLQEPAFWLKSFFFLFLIGYGNGFYQYWHWFEGLKWNEEFYMHQIVGQLKVFGLCFFTLLIFQYFVDRKESVAYGLSPRGFRPWPYFLMLLFMLPLLYFASFQPDFLITYPTFKPWQNAEAFNLSLRQMALIYEAAYGIDFVMVELLFRGALIIGMTKLIGKDALLPMAATYCFLHFGKPMFETVSSIFGGYILGCIAMYSRHIFGGVCIHLGIAWLMEVFAYWQIMRLE